MLFLLFIIVVSHFYSKVPSNEAFCHYIALIGKLIGSVAGENRTDHQLVTSGKRDATKFNGNLLLRGKKRCMCRMEGTVPNLRESIRGEWGSMVLTPP